DGGELAAGEAVQQLGVGIVGERVLALPAGFAGVEVGVAEIQPPARDVVQRRPEPRARQPEALGKERLGLRCRRAKTERLERTDLRQQRVEETDDARDDAGMMVVRAELLVVLASRVGEDERALLHAGRQLVDLLALVPPRGARELWNQLAHRVAIGR